MSLQQVGQAGRGVGQHTRSLACVKQVDDVQPKVTLQPGRGGGRGRGAEGVSAPGVFAGCTIHSSGQLSHTTTAAMSCCAHLPQHATLYPLPCHPRTHPTTQTLCPANTHASTQPLGASPAATAHHCLPHAAPSPHPGEPARGPGLGPAGPAMPGCPPPSQHHGWTAAADT
jgi:hypothetical protein